MPCPALPRTGRRRRRLPLASPRPVAEGATSPSSRAPAGLVLVDGGLPGHLPQLRSYLEGAGRSLGDIRALLLTHAHPDHTGVAPAARQTGADVWVHERDAAGLAGGARAASRQAKPESSLLPYLVRRPATLRMIAYIGRMGGFTGSKVTDPRTVDGDRLLADVPGRPRVVTLPGHTPGSVGSLFADRGLLFTGDALVTYDGITGYRRAAVASRASSALWSKCWHAWSRDGTGRQFLRVDGPSDRVVPGRIQHRLPRAPASGFVAFAGGR